MTYTFLLYCFLSAVLVSGGGYYFYSAAQETTGAIFFLGGIIASIFFGFRWFNSSGDVAGGAAPGSWPPAINYCPDFLTLNTIAGEQVCVDTVGVAQKGGVSNPLSVWKGPTQTSENDLFRLFTNQSGPTRSASLCAQAKSKGVTWEGVWNGTSCTGVVPPLPPKV